jgi:hypothetical protein
VLKETMLFLALSVVILLVGLTSGGHAAPTASENRQVIVVSEDGVAKAVIPAGAGAYSDMAKKKRVNGATAAHVYSLKGIPSTNPNMPTAPGFKQNVTISPAAQNGWLTGDVTKSIEAVRAAYVR